MRRRVEFSSFQNLGFLEDWSLDVYEQTYSSFSKSIGEAIRANLKFTKEELQYCFFCSWYQLLKKQNLLEETSEKYRVFRLAVKKRLKDELFNLPDSKKYPDEFKATLQEAFLEKEASFERTLRGIISCN